MANSKQHCCNQCNLALGRTWSNPIAYNRQHKHIIHARYIKFDDQDSGRYESQNSILAGGGSSPVIIPSAGDVYDFTGFVHPVTILGGNIQGMVIKVTRFCFGDEKSSNYMELIVMPPKKSKFRCTQKTTLNYWHHFAIRKSDHKCWYSNEQKRVIPRKHGRKEEFFTSLPSEDWHGIEFYPDRTQKVFRSLIKEE